jgi:hypothetical protein
VGLTATGDTVCASAALDPSAIHTSAVPTTSSRILRMFIAFT